jgi:inosine-uridine nucleoside N-ribohydrolase
MGGTMSNLGRREHFASDFNFHLDPESTQIVFDHFNNIIMTTLEFPESYRFGPNEGIFAKTSNTKKREYVFDLYSKILYPTLCDPITLFPMFLS